MDLDRIEALVGQVDRDRRFAARAAQGCDHWVSMLAQVGHSLDGDRSPGSGQGSDRGSGHVEGTRRSLILARLTRRGGNVPRGPGSARVRSG